VRLVPYTTLRPVGLAYLPIHRQPTGMPSVTGFPRDFNLSNHVTECKLSSPVPVPRSRFNMTLYESATDSQNPNWTTENMLISLYMRSPDDLYSSTSLGTFVFVSNIDRSAKCLRPTDRPQRSFLHDRRTSTVLNAVRLNVTQPPPTITRTNNIVARYTRKRLPCCVKRRDEKKVLTTKKTEKRPYAKRRTDDGDTLITPTDPGR